MIAHDVLDVMERRVRMVMPVVMDVVVMIVLMMLVVMLMIVVVIVLMAMFMLFTMFVIMAMLVVMIMLVIVMRMIMPVHLLALLDTVHLHGDVSADDAAFYGRVLRVDDIRNPDLVERINKEILVRQQFQKSSGQHIAGSAHSAFQKKSLHFATSIWLIMFARYPAPKPLSMFTTETPLAQEFSMDKRADSPWKDAP